MTLPSDEAISAWLDGAADAETTQLIEAALAADPDFAERVAALAAADDLVRAAYPIDTQVPDALLMRLGLGTAPAAAPAAGAEIVDLAAARARRTPAPAPPRPGNLSRLAAQVALVAGLTGLATGWWLMSPDHAPGATYHALGSAVPESAANGVVMFASGTSAEDARKLLIGTGATPVAGPSEAGAWRVAIAPGARDTVLDRLRARPEVTLAAPIDRAG